ncbi:MULTISPECIES: hypothetical protein [unclassified Dolichospermum]|uniref:hypothetical protein n=1 Tax=unclassified Dolichospermum TaxID=2622029 RepID=UPI001446F57D|nr:MULTISPECIES: hypothetical protein [unclassified Dolichospermum]MTJ15538.1 hypothetical protein [Dolichospermum sp. UHCC 0299]MTJ41373.1 hypothetical protein [Dolichospermum sp. UHCC 0406]
MNNKTPPSEMIRVPTVLIPVVRHLAKIHRDGHTTELLQGLQELIAQFDSSVKLETTSELQQVEEKLGELKTHLCQQDQQVATKLEVFGKQLEKIEKAIVSARYSGGNSRQRYSGYPYQYQQQPVEIKSFAPENLAQRLGVTQQSLTTEWETKSEQEFISWSRNRDPMSLGWKFQVSDGLFYPQYYCQNKSLDNFWQKRQK